MIRSRTYPEGSFGRAAAPVPSRGNVCGPALHRAISAARPENDGRVGTPYENSRRSGVDAADLRARADELAQHMEDAAEDAEAR